MWKKAHRQHAISHLAAVWKICILHKTAANIQNKNQSDFTYENKPQMLSETQVVEDRPPQRKKQRKRQIEREGEGKRKEQRKRNRKTRKFLGNAVNIRAFGNVCTV